jgi:NADPH-dependent 7-cyano-7-deazaguanine reductase QueF
MSLNKLSNFTQVLNSTRKHSIKNEYFPMPILFTIIYLMQKQKLDYINYYEHEINMSNFVQATKHDVHMYVKFGGLSCYEFL